MYGQVWQKNLKFPERFSSKSRFEQVGQNYMDELFQIEVLMEKITVCHKEFKNIIIKFNIYYINILIDQYLL